MSQHGCPERLSNRSKGYQEEGPSQPTMEVLVETLTGTAFEMTVSPSDTIFAIKSKIFRVEGIPVSQQHLLYNLKELEDGSSLRELGVGEGARLRLVLGLRGGPISMRRLPPPPQPDAPWPDIERLLDTNREEGEWESVGGGAGGGAGGCKVTVLVFRDGDRVNMLRVRENDDGTYSPIDHAKYSGGARSVRASSGDHDDGLSGSVQENAVTMGKMLELRRRMESLSVQRATRLPEKGDKPELIQKTRSEETLAVPSLLDDSPSLLDEAGGDVFKSPFSAGYAEECAPLALYDGHYTRYDYDCSFTDRYTLLPPIVVPGSRTESEQSVREAVAAESDRLKLSDALAGSILVKSNRREGADEAAILEESVSFEGTVQHVHSSQHSASLADKTLAPLAHTEYGPLVVGSVGGWRVRGFGSSSQLAPPAPLAAAPPHHSASSLQLRAPAPHPRHQPPPAPLSDALFSSSTSDLEKLKRNRILPALSRHRNREHLHLSDEGLDMSVTSRPRNLEVGSERRQRRIKKIAELEHARTFQFDDPPDQGTTDGETVDTPDIKELEVKEVKKMRIRCGFCRKKLSIATVHKCRCGAEFCAPHRYAEVHGCAYDYKANAHQYLQRANPLVSAPKLPKI